MRPSAPVAASLERNVRSCYRPFVTAEDLSAFWRQSSEEAWKTVIALREKQRHMHALFFCHLTLEKLLKARYVEHHGKPAPPTHDLVWLLDQCALSLPEEDREALGEIAKFNIAGRYEDYKLALHKRATPEYAKTWVDRAASLRTKLQ